MISFKIARTELPYRIKALILLRIIFIPIGEAYPTFGRSKQCIHGYLDPFAVRLCTEAGVQGQLQAHCNSGDIKLKYKMHC